VTGREVQERRRAQLAAQARSLRLRVQALPRGEIAWCARFGIWWRAWALWLRAWCYGADAGALRMIVKLTNGL
jgi:hypothetical protein